MNFEQVWFWIVLGPLLLFAFLWLAMQLAYHLEWVEQNLLQNRFLEVVWGLGLFALVIFLGIKLG